MKRIILLAVSTIFLISCTNNLEDRFRQKFKGYLTNQQIDLILEINSDFDEVVIKKHPKKSKDLKSCYAYMTDQIRNKQEFSEYTYPNDKLIEIQKKIIDTGLFNENESYTDTLFELSKSDSEIKERIDYLSGSGYEYLQSSYRELGFLSHHGEINSISKILLTFHFVVGQIAENNDYNKLK